MQKGYVAALGVGMQGVFTLTPIITPLCFLHWGGAAIFAGAAQAHATVAIEVYQKAVATGASPVCVWSTNWLACCLILGLFWYVLTACVHWRAAGSPTTLSTASSALAAGLSGRAGDDADAPSRSIHGAAGRPGFRLLG